EAAHAGAGVADAAPGAGALDHVAPLGIGLVLRTIEVGEILPARLRAAEGLPVELHVEALGGEEAFLLAAEIAEPHSFRADGDGRQAFGHGDVLPELVGAVCTPLD